MIDYTFLVIYTYILIECDNIHINMLINSNDINIDSQKLTVSNIIIIISLLVQFLHANTLLEQKTDGIRDSMADYLDLYLDRRFPMPQMKIEWGYNLQDALERYSHDDIIGLFWGVLTVNVRIKFN